MPRSRHSAAPRRSLVLATTLLVALACEPGSPPPARVSEETRVLDTYPFSDPNPIPVLATDRRLYPYHTFEGYSATSELREWKVVKMENDLIEVFILPEVGGKVWGAVVKESGHEFIYRNEVIKFRDIALRGPWTSGGVEFNFGVIGHTPATATPVDYTVRENDDGSVSTFVGAMDLPSRTHWRVEIRLPPDKAYFETNALWYNPTPLEQPYYNWMTAAAFAQDDLEIFVPGGSYLEHPGRERSWPIDEEGRFLPLYRNNAFGGNKSYHVVGELNDFFGGYYHDDDYGWGHWARYEDMPGQKMWLWALSRAGGIWEDLLTDTDGQYVEFQAGRLFVQYQPGDHRNPVTQAGFDPVSASRWTETWFPVEGIGGLTDVSREGAMHVEREGSQLRVAINAFGDVDAPLQVWSGDDLVATVTVDVAALHPFEATFEIAADEPFRVALPELDLDYSSDPAERMLDRPFEVDPDAWHSIPEADRLVFEARELAKGRRYAEARGLYEEAAALEPWNRGVLLGLGGLALRSARYEDGLSYAKRALQLDTYDAEANFLAGNLYRALDMEADARDAFGWAARSVAFRAAAYVQLAEIMAGAGEWDEAERYAELAIESDRYSVPGWQLLAVAGRRTGDGASAERARSEFLGIDPLHHFVLSERYLAGPGSGSQGALIEGMRSEYPGQSLVELAIGYANLGLEDDALALLDLADELGGGPLSTAWRAHLRRDASGLGAPSDDDLAFVFPFRTETLPVLRWAAEQSDHWSWRYLLGLNLWALDRDDEAAATLAALGDEPDYGAAYAARGYLLQEARGRDPGGDLARAVELDPEDRLLRIALIRHAQDAGSWDEAVALSGQARGDFPGEFNLALLHVRGLLSVDRPAEAIDVLTETHVLPSENARDSHRLYELAHMAAALDELEAARPASAREHLEAALLWPESLGQGRPYEPDVRLVRYLQGVVAEIEGDDAAARRAYEAAGVRRGVVATSLITDGAGLFTALEGRIVNRAGALLALW
ncbi:MAG: DUF5107 domain-containing protein [Gemmatimonadota bacterium]|nr:DUF5107 domain-containing protein [Gemmatimonadota bacterium]MDE2864850.1 DUF5107 domain-containing protein [Gemmatimonadota bacterium]